MERAGWYPPDVILWVLGSSLAAAQACEGAPPTPREFAERASRAVAYLGEDDIKGFEVGLVGVRADLICLREPLSEQDAADVHVLEGVADWQDGAVGLAIPHLAAAYARNSHSPLTFRDLGHPNELMEAWGELADREEEMKSLPLAARGMVYVDGKPSEDYPVERPWIYQFAGSDGEVTTTVYMPEGEAPPEYPRLRPRLKGIIGATGVGAAAMFALGGVTAWRVSDAHDKYVGGNIPDLVVSPRTMGQMNRASWVVGGVLSAVAVSTLMRLIRTY